MGQEEDLILKVNNVRSLSSSFIVAFPLVIGGIHTKLMVTRVEMV